MGSYRPVPGERLFTSAHGNKPKIITVLEYFWHEQLPKEQLRYVRGDGTKGHYTVDYMEFYPDAPLETKYLYFVQAEESNYDSRSNFYELGYFFKQEEAFQHVRDIKAGKVNLPEDLRHVKEIEFSVLVEEV